MGCSDEDIARAMAEREAAPAQTAAREDVFEVWPENEPALIAFLAMETQWHFHPQSGRHTGLRYGALTGVIKALELPQRDRVFRDVQAIERGAIEALGLQERLRAER